MLPNIEHMHCFKVFRGPFKVEWELHLPASANVSLREDCQPDLQQTQQETGFRKKSENATTLNSVFKSCDRQLSNGLGIAPLSLWKQMFAGQELFHGTPASNIA
jgi:hypothetical protein